MPRREGKETSLGLTILTTDTWMIVWLDAGVGEATARIIETRVQSVARGAHEGDDSARDEERSEP